MRGDKSKTNGNTFYPIIKLLTTWILRKRLANWTYHHNTMGSGPYTYCVGTKVPTQKYI